MLSGQSSVVFGIGNRTNEQRVEGLLDSWLLKVGTKNQDRRNTWVQLLKRNAGRRIRREMMAILRTFYVKDIRRAIELVVEEQTENELTLEPIVLKRKLEEIGATPKGENEETEVEAEVGVTFLQAGAIRDTDPVDARGIRRQILDVVNRILPQKLRLKSPYLSSPEPLPSLRF